MKQLSIERLRCVRNFLRDSGYHEGAKALDELISIREAQGVLVAYVTSDGRMLIFADSPNMLPADKSSLTPLYKHNSCKNCASCDRHYVDGMKAGWNFHEEGDNQGFIDSVERVQNDVRESKNQRCELFTAPQLPVDEKAAFDEWLTSDYSPDGSGRTSEADEIAFQAVLWHVWQARAALSAAPKPGGE